MREAAIHRAVADYLALALPPDAVWSTFPAGGGGHVRGAQLKRAGLLKGFPDLLIIWAGKAALIELKAPQKYPTPEQRAVHAELRAAGAQVAVCRSVAEVEMALTGWGVPLRARTAA